MTLDLDYVRSQFPGLRDDEVFFDNAGGTLALGRVADRVRDYLVHTPHQLGATYAASARAAERYQESRVRIADLVGARRPEEVVFGPSTTILLKFLARAMESRLQPGDEVIVTLADHEANVGCWLELAERCGATIRFWEPDDQTGELSLAALEGLLSERTRLVTMAHVSNLVGTIHDVAGAAALIHAHGAQLCVDGVAFAPHRLLDVAALDVDFYVFSLYKVFGPHHAVLYGKHEALLAVDSINHYFVPQDRVPGKLEPGNANYELSHGAAGVVDYLEDLGQRLGANGASDAATCRSRAWQAIAAHEEVLAERLLHFLRGRSGVRILGRAAANQDERVPTISFVHEQVPAARIVEQVDPHGIGIRFGNFYAARLADHLGLDANGVVRVSMVHYNTVAEVDRLIRVLEDLLP